jgi:hypothetical protein
MTMASTDLSHFSKTSTAMAALLLCAATLLPMSAARAADGTDGSQCRALAQQMLNALLKGDSKAATHAFDTDMRSALPPAKLSELWSEVQSNYGRFKAQSTARTLKVNGMDVVITPLQFTKTSLDAQVACNAHGQIAGFFLRPTQT